MFAFLLKLLSKLEHKVQADITHETTIIIMKTIKTLLPVNLEHVARKYTLGRGETLPRSCTEHVVSIYKPHF